MMAIYRVETPDGKVLKIEGPEGASQDEVLAQAEALYSEQQQSPMMRWQNEQGNEVMGRNPPQDRMVHLERADAPYDPTEGMSGPERFAAGAGKFVADMGRGVGQMAGVVDEADVARARELDAPLMETGAGKAGYVGGGIASAVPAAFVPGANTFTGATLLGGAYGAAMPTAEDESRLRNTAMGAGFGLGTRAGIGGVTKAGEKIGRMLPGAPRRMAADTLNRAAGGQRRAVIEALESPDEFGQTAGQAAARTGNAEIPALQRAVERRDPTKYAQIADQRASNQLAPIRDIGGRGGRLEAATAQRKADAARNYGAAFTDSVKKLPANLRKDPYVRRAISNANDLAQSAGVKRGTTEYYHLTKQALDDLAASQDVGTNEARIIEGARRRFTQWLSEKNPAYNQARETFAQQSVPINRMQVGRQIEESLTPAINEFGEGAANLRRTTMANALRNAPQTIKKATGSPRYQSIDEVLTPEQAKRINAIAKSFASDANYERLAKLGNQKAKEVLQEGTQLFRLPGMLERNVLVANAILGRAAKGSEKKVMQFLADNMDDPQRIAEIMQSANPSQRRALSTLMNVIRTAGPASAAQAAGGS